MTQYQANTECGSIKYDHIGGKKNLIGQYYKLAKTQDAISRNKYSYYK